MSKHTPGPWAWAADYQFLVSARKDGSIPLNAKVVVQAGSVMTQENADLIATAPELLALCKRALDHSARVHPDFMADLYAAIAKAEGAA